MAPPKGHIPWNKGKKNCYSKETLRKMSESHKGLMAGDKNPSKRPEVRKKISESAKKRAKEKPHTVFQKGYTPWNKGLTKEQDERLKKLGEKSGNSRRGVLRGKNPKISEKLKGNTNFLGKSHKEETKKTISETVKKKWKEDHWYQLTPEGKQKQREIALKLLRQPKRRTSIEIEMENELKRRKINYESQVPLLNRYCVDFLIEDFIVIECDGLRWHNLPNIQEKDKIRDKKLKEAGFVVFRFWENEIHKNVSKCVDKVVEQYPAITQIKQLTL